MKSLQTGLGICGSGGWKSLVIASLSETVNVSQRESEVELAG